MSDYQQLFILGAPRSGTTFLSSLLKHEFYGNPFESQFIIKYQIKARDMDLSNQSVFNNIVQGILKERAVAQYVTQLDIDAFYDSLNGDMTYYEIVNRICLLVNVESSDLNDITGVHAWADKTPHYLENLDEIVRLFPDARFIYIVRDGRDVALSLLKKPWGPNNIYSCAQLWKRYNEKFTGLINDLEQDNRLLKLRYEDLSSDIEQTIKSIFGFLQIPVSDDKISHLSATLINSNYDKWMTQMSPRQIKIFEAVAHNTLTRFDYRLHAKPGKISPVSAFFYKLHNKTVWLMHMFKLNIIDGLRIRFFGKERFVD